MGHGDLNDKEMAEVESVAEAFLLMIDTHRLSSTAVVRRVSMALLSLISEGCEDRLAAMQDEQRAEEADDD